METMKQDFKRRAEDEAAKGDGGCMVLALFACGAFWSILYFMI